MPKPRTYSRYAHDVAVLMGEQIKLGRKQRGWTERDLAERAGMSRATLQKIEKGDMGVAIGSVFELAALVGVKLFEPDSVPLVRQIEHARDKIALLPQRIRARTKELYDDF